MRPVEEYVGSGELSHKGSLVGAVRYRLTRHQGFAPNGLPVPGVFRIEGTLDAGARASFARLVGAPVTLRLSDGRILVVTVADATGRVLSEGHGPSRCSCC
jgi:hypothetical protein